MTMRLIVVLLAVIATALSSAIRISKSDGFLFSGVGMKHEERSDVERRQGIAFRIEQETQLYGDDEQWTRSAGKAGGAHGQMLISADQTRILKPMDQGDESFAELRAYGILRRTPLGPFLCTLFGTRRLHDSEYMEIESAYIGMTGPTATLDIKLGRITWADTAPIEKIKRHKEKFEEFYSNSTAAFGYRVAGMKAAGLTLNAQVLKERRSLVREEFSAWLLPAFFASDPGFGSLPPGLAGQVQPKALTSEVDVQAAREMLSHLRVLSFAAEMGFGGNLRSSSILLTREMRLGGRWALHLIDFAHYTPDDKYDANFCDGLRNLIKVWEEWLE